MRITYWVLASAVVLACRTAWSDIVVHDISDRAASALRSLGTSFIVGCLIIAVGAVVVAAMCKARKG